MRKFASYTLALVAASAAALHAQETAPGACSTPESIIVTGNARVDSAAIRSTGGLSTGSQLNVHHIQGAIRSLYATGQFDDVQVICRVAPST
jgi:outer membrane protein assembly factor BamA